MSRSPNHPPAPNQHKLGNNAAAASVPVPEEQSPAQLATLLATAYAENENLRRDSQITQRRAEKAERMLESFSGDPNRDGPARAVQQAEARAEKAELQRDEAEAQLRRVLDEWHRLDEYLNDAEVKLMAARKGIGAVLQSSRSGALRYADQMHRAESPYQQQGMPPPHHQRGMVPPLPPLRRRVEEAEGAPPSKRSRSTRDYAENLYDYPNQPHLSNSRLKPHHTVPNLGPPTGEWDPRHSQHPNSRHEQYAQQQRLSPSRLHGHPSQQHPHRREGPNDMDVDDELYAAAGASPRLRSDIPGEKGVFQTHIFAPPVTGAPVKKSKFANLGLQGTTGHLSAAAVQARPSSLSTSFPAVEPPSQPFPQVNEKGERLCRQCGHAGRYREGKCVEKWGPGPLGPGTVCDRCRKKMKRVERRGTMDTATPSMTAPIPATTPTPPHANTSPARPLDRTDTMPAHPNASPLSSDSPSNATAVHVTEKNGNHPTTNNVHVPSDEDADGEVDDSAGSRDGEGEVDTEILEAVHATEPTSAEGE